MYHKKRIYIRLQESHGKTKNKYWQELGRTNQKQMQRGDYGSQCTLFAWRQCTLPAMPWIEYQLMARKENED